MKLVSPDHSSLNRLYTTSPQCLLAYITRVTEMSFTNTFTNTWYSITGPVSLVSMYTYHKDDILSVFHKWIFVNIQTKSQSYPQLNQDESQRWHFVTSKQTFFLNFTTVICCLNLTTVWMGTLDSDVTCPGLCSPHHSEPLTLDSHRSINVARTNVGNVRLRKR